MLSDVARLRSLDRRKRRAAAKSGWYSDQQKLEAVKLWLLTGSMPQTAAALNININTIEKWRYTGWWKELTDQLKAEGRIQLGSRLSGIVSKSLSQMEDRIENGDWLLDSKTGSLIRKPMLGRDLLRISSDLIDKTRKLESVTREEATVQAVEDRLKLLADSFATFAKKVRRVEIEDIDEAPLQITQAEESPEAPEEGVLDHADESSGHPKGG